MAIMLHSLLWVMQELGFWMKGLLKGSWDLVTRVIIKVAILIITYNPQLRYL